MTFPNPIALTTVAIDFDGVIHKYSQGWHDGTCYDDPMDGALESVRELMGHRPVVVFTARPVVPVADWLAKHAPDIPLYVDTATALEYWDNPDVLLVTNRKVVAKHYIDDRAIRHVEWPRSMAMIRMAEDLAGVGFEAPTVDLT